ncbi:MAG: hypothetical protein Q8Q42_00770 [Nanoarchaeota archaeon]|nr:hypothetical protein [Nanoarchaeota archaeon]
MSNIGYQELIAGFVEYFSNVIVPRSIEMFVATIQKKNTIEILVPLVVTLFLIQTYFGRNKDEELGWNTAYANCIVLLFVTAHLASYVYENYGLSALDGFGTAAYYKTLFVLILGLTALSLMFIDFFHSIDERMSFLLSNNIFIVFLSFVSIVLVYTDIPFNRDTLVASVFILLTVVVFFYIFKWLIPPSESAEEFLEKKKEKRVEIIKGVARDVRIGKNRAEKKIVIAFMNMEGGLKSFAKRIRGWLGFN